MLIILIILTIFFLIVELDYTNECAISSVCLICEVVAVLMCSMKLADFKKIDDKIAMYELDNAEIELNMCNAVSRYTGSEILIDDDLSSSDMIELVSSYPELLSEKYISDKLDTYFQNKRNIQELEMMLSERKRYRLWLYLGR